MRNVWVKVIPWNPKLAQAAIESGADALCVEAGRSQEARRLGVVKTVAPDGDYKFGSDVVEKAIRRKKDEAEILALSLLRKVILKNGDWKIIPIENLLARTDNLFMEIHDLREGETAFSILEKGVQGVVVDHRDPSVVREIVRALKKPIQSLELSVAKVKRIEPLGVGDRVCVDTCSCLSMGEGMLVGNASHGLFLIHSENVENPFVEPRPFRVNAGALHAYIWMARGETKYLSELRSGDRALVVDFQGKNYPVVVGRAKVERRPLVLVEAEEQGQSLSIILQNAETIRLTQPHGKPISLVDLKEGSEVLVYREASARHCGISIDETIVER